MALTIFHDLNVVGARYGHLDPASEQTWLVATRTPLLTLRELGPIGFARMTLLLAGTPIAACVNAIFWFLTVLWLLGQPAFIAEAFPPRVRYSGASLGYHLASVTAGGPAPIIAGYLLATFGSSLAIVAYIVVCALISFWSAWVLRGAALALGVGPAGGGGGVIVSRGELVEIGGGVRIPEIVRRAGAKLIEVGTTNRTRAEDYAAPLSEGRAHLVLRVHRSNFRLEGFVEDPDFAAVAALAHEHGAIVVDDLGSGALLDTARFGLPHEPLPAERLSAGADLVTFSGDKLVGGPQAGLIVGRGDLIARLRKDPLARAMRPAKETLAAVAATLGLYRAGRAEVEVPLWRAVATPLEELEARARRLSSALGGLTEAVPTEATFGGGALPGEVIASFGVALAHAKPDALAAALRTGRPAVVGRIEPRRIWRCAECARWGRPRHGVSTHGRHHGAWHSDG